MTHLSDDDLVLHYYGELPEADAHVAECVSCAGRASDLALFLTSVSDEVPERGDLYGREVWYRVRPHLTARTSWFGRGAASFLASASMRWVLAGAAVVTLVASGFVAGRLSSTSPVVTEATRTASEAADPALARRVLLLTVADHLERSDRVLTDIMNAPVADISVEQQWADDLIAANRLYRQDALDANEASVADVLDELERTLLDVVHRPSESPADLDQIRRRIDSAALLFKVRVLTTELRQRQLAPDAASASAASPIS